MHSSRERHRIGSLPRLAAVVAVLTLTTVSAQTPGYVDEPGAAAVMQRFLAGPMLPRDYSAARRLEASGSGQKGWLDAATAFSAESGFVYEVTDEGGSGLIRRRVLRSLLDEEQQLIARGATGTVALSPANYRFTARGFDAEGLAVIEMEPLRRDRSLIRGHMFLTADAGLVRIEGQLAKNPSFWTTRVDVVRSYENVSGVVMPVALRSTAQLRFFGRSSLEMTYRYSSVDGRPVVE